MKVDKVRLVALFLVFFLSYSLLAPIKVIGKEDGKLDAFEKEISGGSDKDNNQDVDNGSEEKDSDSFDEFWDKNHDLLDLDWDDDEKKYSSNSHNYKSNTSVKYENGINFSNISYRVSVANHFVSDDITGLRLNLKLGLNKFGLNFNYSDYKEELNNGDEHLYFTEGLITYDFLSDQGWKFIGGFGLENISGDEDNLGLKFACEMNYSQAPITVYFDLGTSYFEDSTLTELTPGISYSFGTFEIEGAYRVLKVSDQKLEGPELKLIYNFD